MYEIPVFEGSRGKKIYIAQQSLAQVKKEIYSIILNYAHIV